MAAKFGTLIHLGGVAHLVLKAQMGSEFEKASVIWAHKHIDASFKIHPRPKAVKEEEQNILQNSKFCLSN